MSCIASEVTQPSRSWAMCNRGSSADFACGYRAMISSARLRSGTVNGISGPPRP